MRIGIDISPITAVRTGVGQYCFYLLKNVLALATDCEFAGFSSGSARVELGPLAANISHHHIPLPTRVVYSLWTALGRPKVDTFLGGVDVYHATNYFLPPTRTARRVVSVHDLAFLRIPGLCSPKIRGILSKRIRGFVQEADAVITCSEATRADAIELLDADPSKITTIYDAVDEMFAPMDREAAAAYVAEHYGIRQPYLLFVSTLEPRKNVPTLLRAFAQLKNDIPHTLVLAGGVGWNAEPIFQTLAELNLASRVAQIGFVRSHAELPAFYSAADAFVFPTLYEGFGLSILEAMTCGCPVVTSNNSSIPEVTGGAALCVDALDTDAFANALRRLLEDAPLRESMIAHGREHAQRFSWKKCAQQTLDIYRQLSKI